MPCLKQTTDTGAFIVSDTMNLILTLLPSLMELTVISEPIILAIVIPVSVKDEPAAPPLTFKAYIPEPMTTKNGKYAYVDTSAGRTILKDFQVPEGP